MQDLLALMRSFFFASNPRSLARNSPFNEWFFIRQGRTCTTAHRIKEHLKEEEEDVNKFLLVFLCSLSYFAHLI